MIKKIGFAALLLTIAISSSWSQVQRGRGFPEKNPPRLYENFKMPPKGYGNVPFYWWNGDSLNKERLQEQLKILAEAPIDGFAVSYAHTDPRVDKEMARNGYGFAGNTEPGAPEIFSEKWWEVWKWYAAEAAKYNMGVGLDDYTFGWPDNGYLPDQIRDLPEMKNYQGTLHIAAVEVKAGDLLEKNIPENFVTAVAWPGKVLLKEHIRSGQLRWNAPKGNNYTVYIITTQAGFAIHPEHGKKLVDLYFNQFEKKLTAAEFQGLNYFFQDELTYPISMLSWSANFQEEFMKRKGYDILPYLPALTNYIGLETPKIRLDYADVLLDLAEERYFKPIYDWHADKKLMYGSDNHGRGKDPLAYVDYFRANSWYTAPGNDAPSRGSSFLETKVSSSIAHLYNRPRTWLEAFHSMGWGSTGAWLTEQIDHHFIAGGNLVCMHGLYYSTHGGWWEWAPPDFHFRMPYWPHMIKWLQYVERMSYVLSQGKHVSDIAIMYPTEAMQAYPDAKPAVTFNLAMKLSEQGLDYDFMHYKPLREAKTVKGRLLVKEQSYRVLILADLKACHHSTLLKAVAHYRNGGVVIATGNLPQATTLEGENSLEVKKILEELFAPTGGTHASGGRAKYVQPEEVVATIKQLTEVDFMPFGGKGKVLHRSMGDKKLYMVMNVEKGDTCFFRAKGKVELWNAMDGSKENYPVLKVDEKGTYLKMNKATSQSYLIVFSPGEPDIYAEEEVFITTDTMQLTSAWKTTFLPTMNNKWGDYRLPAANEMIGPEAPVFKYRKTQKGDQWYHSVYKDSLWRESIHGYGIQAETIQINSDTAFNQAIQMVHKDNSGNWQPYEFSWKHGVWDNPGPQGFHGLKSRVSNAFFILNSGAHEFYRTNVWVPQAQEYKMIIEGSNPDYLQVDGKDATTQSLLSLKKGWHSLLIGYKSAPVINYRRSNYDNDPRRRSMVVFIPRDELVPEKTKMYDNDVASSWAMTNHLLFSPYKEAANSWQFRIATVPGVKTITLEIMGELTNAWIGGQKINAKEISWQKGKEKKRVYTIAFRAPHDSAELLALEIKAEPGYQGAAIIPVPVKFDCGNGIISLGNWAEKGSLRYYSGGMFYRNNFRVAAIGSKRFELELGNVIATCEVKVNGHAAGVLMAPPYKIDITKYMKQGENDIEILVYSTLANHYQTIPSIYRGKPDAGLIGPVQIFVQERIR